MHLNDDKLISLLNSGNVLFEKHINVNILPSVGQIHVRVSYITGGREEIRNLYLKGQMLSSENQTPAPKEVHEIIPNGQTEQQSTVRHGYVGSLVSGRDTFDKALFPQKRVFIQHSRLHFSEKHYKYSPFNLNSHTNEHSGNRLYHNLFDSDECKTCNKVFSNKEEFMLHMYIHTGEKPYLCSQCDQGFLQKSDLKKHMDTHKLRNKLEMRHYCNQCNKSFLRTYDLKNHMELHAIERLSMKIYKCSLCYKAFKDKDELEEHNVNHNEESPSPFKVSDKMFIKNRIGFEKHKKTHTGEKSHQSSECGKYSLQDNIIKGDEEIQKEENQNQYNQYQCGLSQDKSSICHTNIQFVGELEFVKKI